MPNAAVSDFEMRVLSHLWTQGSLTARQLTDLMYPETNHASYMTVKKLLERLEAKRFVTRSTEERAHRFAASVAREEIIAGELESVVDKLCDGSIAPLVSALVKGVSLTKKQRTELNQLILDFQAKSKRNKGGKQT